ncbi:glycosyltransferase [Sphingobacterium faecium]|uniref:glycosyltransferase n=1 Tax=Sphingobacterium faecium TaxID=34087 RepID=UPI00320947B1
MQKSQLTIIIPFLNEGIEVENTVSSILETSTTNPSIILINDFSDDGYDYDVLSSRSKSILLINHEKRYGVANSRNEGVKICDTEYFLLLDAHMRFYEEGWDRKLISHLEENQNSLLCSQTKFLMKDINGSVINTEENFSYGAYIDDINKLNILWNKFDTNPLNNIIETPCILGAAYACSKIFWNHMRGLNGLLSYGLDEQLLSIKVWLAGGKCLLIKDWVVGHIYRDSFPYSIPNKNFLYNKLYLAELLFPVNIKQEVFHYQKQINYKIFEESYSILRRNYVDIKKEKAALKNIFTKKLSSFFKANRRIKLMNSVQIK